jgi:hypothetical protein
MVSRPAPHWSARWAGPVLYLCAALVQTGCASGSATARSAPMYAPTAPNFVARVVMACRETEIGPSVGPYSQVNLVVAIASATVGNAGIVIDGDTQLYMRTGARSMFITTPGSIIAGDELEVWHDGRPAMGAVQSPPGTPVYLAKQAIIRPRVAQATLPKSGDTLVACRYDSK